MSEIKKKNKLEAKIIFIGIIVLLVWLASTFVFNQVKQRNNLFNQAQQSVAEQWGKSQVLKGPMISYPYMVQVNNGASFIEKEKYAYILPDQLNVSATIHPEKRRRGIYDSVVYTTELNISGDFVLDEKGLGQITPGADLDRARLFVALEDTRGIKEQFSLNWNGKEIPFEPSTHSDFLVHTKVSQFLFR